MLSEGGSLYRNDVLKCFVFEAPSVFASQLCTDSDCISDVLLDLTTSEQ